MKTIYWATKYAHTVKNQTFWNQSDQQGGKSEICSIKPIYTVLRQPINPHKQTCGISDQPPWHSSAKELG